MCKVAPEHVKNTIPYKYELIDNFNEIFKYFLNYEFLNFHLRLKDISPPW